ncbi:hypothetical protein C2E23DRAFT_690271, partial [Lenzites betulinus]
PPPEGGLPVVALGAPDALFEGLARSRLAVLWNEDQDTMLMAHIYNSGHLRPGQARPLTDVMMAAIRCITGESTAIVVPPEPDWVAIPGRRATPTGWALLHLSPESTQTLLERRVWSSPAITFLVYPRSLVIPRFLLTLTGFAHRHDILQTIWDGFRGEVILPTIYTLIRTNPRYAGVDPDVAAEQVLATIEVTIDELQNGNIHARVYMESPTASPRRWVEWRDFLSTIPFESNINATATAARPTQCAGCHGVDHPSHLCPFHDVPGWNAPRA